MKYFIKTYGCQANLADTARISGILDLLGFSELKLPEFKTEKEGLFYVLSNADIFIINSCSVRQKSEDKIYGIGKEAKENFLKIGKKPYIILAGCIVGSTIGERKRFEPSELVKKTKWVDLYLDHSSVGFLPGILKDAGLLPNVLKKITDNIGFENAAKPDSSDPKHAYVNISTGCDNFCTYCVVPYARGKEISRSEEEIIREIKTLVKKGAEYITLCGQNVNSWNLSYDEKFKIRSGSRKKLPFVSLLKKIHEIDGVKKLDFISSNPFDFTKDLVEALKLPKISNYIHIAVQSGNNEVLKNMNRRHTVEEFIKLITSIRKAKPGIEIGTDIIVGFPGETEKQFMDTVKLVEKVKFNVAFIAMYSQRKGTLAEKNFKDDVSRDEKKRRLAYITKVWRDSKKSLPAKKL